MLRAAGYVSTMSLKIERYDLVGHGRVLATRPVGREVGAAVAARLADSRGLLLSFYGVDVASPSFLREVVGALRGVLLSSDQHWLLLIGMNEDVRESVQLVLRNEKIVLGVLEDEQIQLLGGPEHLSQTMREAQELGTFTAPEMADRLKVKLPALHQRLNQLMEAGLLSREDDSTATRGKRGKYSAPPADELQKAREGKNPGIAVLASTH